MQYKVIVAANRDEFYDRKTAPAAFWKDQPEILGGRDLEAAGTWMAMNTTGKISLVTNYRDPAHINTKASSRGKLVSDFLMSDKLPEAYLRELEPQAKLYNGFNLLAGQLDEWWYLSNYQTGIQKLEAGVYGISNHLLDTPWPKVIQGKEKFSKLLELRIWPEDLFGILYDEQRAEDHTLPDTGIGIEWERALSSMFIKTKGYGTRCSTVLLIDRENRVQFYERSFNIETFSYSARGFRFNVITSPRAS
ncbi:MAG: NRDE family protein [Cyclobacteriaceae bacterium]|nr:NRDE family protein [Cyclobacteriaceae bacterium]